MATKNTIVINPSQYRRLERIAKVKGGYEVGELIWDAIDYWLATKGPCIALKKPEKSA
jgi:hypothetical protein